MEPEAGRHPSYPVEERSWDAIYFGKNILIIHINFQDYSYLCTKKTIESMRIGIIVAMDKELLQLQQVFKDSDVIVEKCGIGKVNAALGAQRMINTYNPDCIISSGCAGGNGDDINIQDIIVSSELCYHDVYCGRAIDDTTVYGQVQGLPARYQADPYLMSKAEQLKEKTVSSDFKIHKGLIVTGDWFVDSKEKMREIVGHFPEAKAIDMESCAIAQTCYINKVPFISFRVISDIPLRDTDASQYHNFWDTVAANSFMTTKAFVESL
jgi:adenosylhomocysteine nucleosidase